VEKLTSEDQAERELREFFSAPRSTEDAIKEMTRKEGKYVLSTLQVLSVLLAVLMPGSDYPSRLRERAGLFRAFIHNQSDQIAFLKAWEKFTSRTPGAEPQTLHVMKW